jgi:excisionase family DNA binding protein
MTDQKCKSVDRGPMGRSVEAAAVHAGCSRTTIYEAIKSGALRARKLGSRTIIVDEDLRNWLQSLPAKEVA